MSVNGGGTRPIPGTLLVLIIATAMAGALASCGSSSGSRGAGNRGTTVPAKVLAGPSHARMVVVPVSIENHGPYLFALDTGAAKSVVDSSIAGQVGLPNEGSVPGGISGIASSEPATQVRVSRWSVANLNLAPDTAVAIPLTQHQPGSGVDGLLGSDELSKYRSVTVDYSAQTLTFR